MFSDNTQLPKYFVDPIPQGGSTLTDWSTIMVYLAYLIP